MRFSPLSLCRLLSTLSDSVHNFLLFNYIWDKTDTKRRRSPGIMTRREEGRTEDWTQCPHISHLFLQQTLLPGSLKTLFIMSGDQIFVQICTFFIFKLKPPLLPADSVGFYVPRVQIRKANGITYMGRRATDTTRSIAVKNNIYRPSIIFRPSNKRSGTGIISDAVILTQQLTCVPVSQASHCQI